MARTPIANEEDELIIVCTMVMQALAIYFNMRRYYQNRILYRAPRRDWRADRELTLNRMYNTDDRICHELLRMKMGPFHTLCSRLGTYGLAHSRSVRIEEQVAMFLYTIGHDHRNRVGRFTFFRSGQTISYYFHRVLNACIMLYRDVVTNATAQNSPYDNENVQNWFHYFEKMQRRPFLVPRRPTGSSSSAPIPAPVPAPVPAPIPARAPNQAEEISQATLDTSKKQQIRWSHDMDDALVDTLLEIVLAGPRRSENGFKNDECTKVVKKILERCQMNIGVVHVRSRLKTLKNDYKEIFELSKISGFGIDAGGRVTSDPLVWEKYFKENPNGKDLRGKLCPRFHDLTIIFGNDTATGARAVSGHDFVMTEDDINNPMGVGIEDENEVDEVQPSHSNTSMQGSMQRGSSRGKRKRGKPMDEAVIALTSIAQSTKEIALAFKSRSCVDVQGILDKLKRLGLGDEDIMTLMHMFERDENAGRFFLGITDEAFTRAWINSKLDK